MYGFVFSCRNFENVCCFFFARINSRLSYLHRLLALKADYAARLHSVQRHLMREPGPLAFEMRHYVALLASGNNKSILISIGEILTVFCCGFFM